MSRGSKLRRKAISQDVERRAWYAFSSGNRDNPYPQDDKRHALFASKLAHIEFVDHEVEAMNEAYGCDTSTWARRQHPNPGPVRPIEQLTLR